MGVLTHAHAHDSITLSYVLLYPLLPFNMHINWKLIINDQKLLFYLQNSSSDVYIDYSYTTQMFCKVVFCVWPCSSICKQICPAHHDPTLNFCLIWTQFIPILVYVFHFHVEVGHDFLSFILHYTHFLRMSLKHQIYIGTII